VAIIALQKLLFIKTTVIYLVYAYLIGHVAVRVNVDSSLLIKIIGSLIDSCTSLIPHLNAFLEDLGKNVYQTVRVLGYLKPFIQTNQYIISFLRNVLLPSFRAVMPESEYLYISLLTYQYIRITDHLVTLCNTLETSIGILPSLQQQAPLDGYFPFFHI